jgi:hypothetical protein
MQVIKNNAYIHVQILFVCACMTRDARCTMCLMLPRMLFDLFHIPDHLVCVYAPRLIVVLVPLCVHVQQFSRVQAMHWK